MIDFNGVGQFMFVISCLIFYFLIDAMRGIC